MYKPIIFFGIPTFLYYIMKFPGIVFRCLFYLFEKEKIKKYFETLRYLNEIRKVCGAHSDVDKRGNENIKCQYKIEKNGILVRVRFLKKGTELIYENFKTEISKFTLSATIYEFKKGWAYFKLFYPPVAMKKIKNEYHKISIGTGIDGFVLWDFDVYSCCLIAGKPRNGKTTELMYMINALKKVNYDIWMIDGKVVDYVLERDSFRYYVQNKNLKEVCEFVESFHNNMEKRYLELEELGVNNYRKTDFEPVFLICDEYLSVVDRVKKEMKKAEYERLIYMIGDIIRRGPASGFQLILTMQRADTNYILGEMRANIQLKIVMGDGGEELYKMMFDEKLDGLELGFAWYSQGTEKGVIAVPFYEKIIFDEEEKK